MAITAAQVKELRDITGAGMMACKKALAATEGDMDKAVEFLREQGLAGAEKKAGRIAAEGVSFAKVSEDMHTGVVVEVNAETDFVAKNALEEVLGYYLEDVASLLVLIFFAAQFCLIFKETNIGLFIVASLSELINKFQFTGLLLVVVTFLVVAISTFFVPMASTKWAMMSPVIVPMFMQSSMTPEFAEAVFRAADSSVKGLTPIFSYFVILIGFLHIYNKRKNDVITISDAMSLMVPYAIAFTILWLIIILAFSIIGIPIGIGTGVML